MKLELKEDYNSKLTQDFIKINIEYNTPKKEVEKLIEYIENYNKTIFLDDNYILEKVLLKNIIYFYSEDKNNYCKTEKKIYKIKSKLYEIEKLSTDFIRISKNCIVNIEHIKNFDISKTGSIKINMDDNTYRIVSRRKIRDIIEFFDEKVK